MEISTNKYISLNQLGNIGTLHIRYWQKGIIVR